MNLFRNLNHMAGIILLVGLVLAVSLILIGLIGQGLLSGTWEPLPVLSAHNLREYIIEVLQMSTQEGKGCIALVNGGIAVLLLTPFINILFAMLFFVFQEHNWAYSTITGFIVTILIVVLFII